MSDVIFCEHRHALDDCDRCRLADPGHERRLTAHFAALRTVSADHFRLSPGSAIELLVWLNSTPPVRRLPQSRT